MRTKRFYVLPLILLAAASVAVILPSALVPGNVTTSATGQAKPNPSPQVIRISKPTPTPAKKLVVGTAPQAGTNKRPAVIPKPTGAQQKQGRVGSASQQTGGTVTKRQPITRQPSDKFIAGIPNINIDLSASTKISGESVHYKKEHYTTEPLWFKLLKAPPDVQKIVWQISSQAFTKPKDGLDWKSPAGLLASGDLPPDKPSITTFFIDLPKFLGKSSLEPRFVYVRALALKAGSLAAKPSNDVVINYSDYKGSDITLGHPDWYPKGGQPGTGTPTATSTFSIVRYKPPIRISSFGGCKFILTKTPPTGELKFILSKINATTPGTRFTLCPEDYAYLKKMLTPEEWLLGAFQDLLKAIKYGYNWLDDKYNYLENQLVAALEAAKIPYAREIINYYKSIYGLQVSYGNFDEALNHGKAAFAAHLANSGEISDNEKPNIVAKFNEFVEEVRKQANGGDDPNRFYRADPDFVPTPGYVVVRLQCTGKPAAVCGKRSDVTIKFVTSAKDDAFLGNFKPTVPLFEVKFETPWLKAGEVIDIPVYLNESELFTNDRWLWDMGFINPKPGKLSVDDYNSIWIVAYEKYPK